MEGRHIGVSPAFIGLRSSELTKLGRFLRPNSLYCFTQLQTNLLVPLCINHVIMLRNLPNKSDYTPIKYYRRISSVIQRIKGQSYVCPSKAVLNTFYLNCLQLLEWFQNYVVIVSWSVNNYI
jgi:hypothetical protein